MVESTFQNNDCFPTMTVDKQTGTCQKSIYIIYMLLMLNNKTWWRLFWQSVAQSPFTRCVIGGGSPAPIISRGEEWIHMNRPATSRQIWSNRKMHQNLPPTVSFLNIFATLQQKTSTLVTLLFNIHCSAIKIWDIRFREPRYHMMQSHM